MIFVVEDDQSIRDLILYTLQTASFQAKGLSNGADLFDALKKQTPDLILLDIMLPDEDGISVLKKLKKDAATADIPVIMETARTAEYDKVTGLDLGADDYLAKPFGMMEMVSRIRAVLRRTQKASKNLLIQGPITMNTKEHLVLVNGEQIDLTRKEYDLLKTFMKNPRIVFSRDELLSSIWGIDFSGGTRTVDVHVNTLRSKLHEAGDLIQTVRGVGYRIDARGWEGQN